jgi:hypothetical protein
MNATFCLLLILSMIKFRLLISIAFMPVFLCAQNFGGNPPGIQWNQINTNKVRVIFPKGLDSQANRIANTVGLLSNTTSQTIGGRYRKWNILLQNQTTVPNAYVRMAPLMSELYMTPAQDNFSTGSLRWDDNLIIHEERHIQQFSNFNVGVARLFSFFLGQEGQLLANGIFIPNYFFEGDATWQETLVSRQGRGRLPSFYNGFKALWMQQKDYSYMKIRSGSYKDFVPDHYPLGYMMVAYGNAQYGEKFWSKVTRDALRLKGYKRAIKRYSGKNNLKYYNDAMRFFKQQAIDSIKNKMPLHFITSTKKNNVVDYHFPVFISRDSVLVSKKSFKEPSAFYILENGKETKIRTRDQALDEYYSYRNGNIVYASFHSDPRWGNRDYSVINLLNIHTKKHRQLTSKTNYFSPDINEDGSAIIAVATRSDGSNSLVTIAASSGKLLQALPNPNNYFFTQTKYITKLAAVSAVRNPEGKMALVNVNLANGETSLLTPFTFNVLGYPCVKGDTVYYTYMNEQSDKVFAVLLSNKRIFKVSNNTNGIYHPAVNDDRTMLVSAFTADGYRLASIKNTPGYWEELSATSYANTPDLYTAGALKQTTGSKVLSTLEDSTLKVTAYKKTSGLFNFHSWRPVAEDPEFGYALYSNNVLSSFNNTLSYLYNRSERSHTVGFTGTYAGLYPLLSVRAEHSFNRSLDTAVGKPVQFNSAKLQGVVSVPLSFVGGRNNQFLNMGAGYTIEPFYYRGISKNVFNNKMIHYANAFFAFSNQSRQAKQNIFPRWAQIVSLSYRDAFTFRNSHKFVGNAAIYFPGLFKNHSFVVNASLQKRDSLPDLFSKTFSYSRGYEALSTRMMYKVGFNYHLPLLYPDWGVANAIFIQRIRSNTFYDHTIARARQNGILTDLDSRSAGAELFFDTKVWNALPVSIGVRYVRLLNVDLFNPSVKNRWEIIIPIGLIPD